MVLVYDFFSVSFAFQVNGQPTLPKDLSLSQEIIDDTVSILLADGGTARELERELQNIDFKLGFKV